MNACILFVFCCALGASSFVAHPNVPGAPAFAGPCAFCGTHSPGSPYVDPAIPIAPTVQATTSVCTASATFAAATIETTAATIAAASAAAA